MPKHYTRGQTILVTFVAAFAALLIGIAVGSGSLDGILKWQTPLGALFTLATVIVAIWNVRRQLRMNLMAREESLMEDRYPGLQQAYSFVSFFNLKLGDKDIYKKLPDFLHEYRARGPRDVVMQALEKRIPLADTSTKFLLAGEFGRLNFGVDLIEESSALKSSDDDLDDIDQRNAAALLFQGRGYVDDARIALEKIEVTFSGRLRKWQERLPRFRAEIEAYFTR